VHGSPAAAAGVKTGDLITSIDGSDVRDGGELLQILAKRQAGDQVKLGIMRDRGKMEMNVMLKRRSELFEEQR
jgi:S1-C subfamily serine protease